MVDFKLSTPEKRSGKWKWPVLVLLAGAAAAGWWRFVYVPRHVEPLYRQATQAYHDEDYRQAATLLERAYSLNSHDQRVNILLGWCYWRLEQSEKAAAFFGRAYHSDPSSYEAELGFAYALRALKEPRAMALFEDLARKRPANAEVEATLGQMYVEDGKNVPAARAFLQILERSPENQGAQRQLLNLYGYRQYHPGLPLGLPKLQRPAKMEIHFRTQGNYLQFQQAGEWKNLYIMGVNLGPARPNEFPSTASQDFWTYWDWMKEIAAMNANTIRIYEVLPPAFYQALKEYNETAPKPIWLIQEVWLSESVLDLYDPKTLAEFKQGLTTAIDVLHGQADIGYRRGYCYGVYTADVSPYVLAVAVGREVEPRVAWETNKENPKHTSYHGEYVSLPEGNPTEAWFASMCDFAARYETEKYNAQHPLTVVNWPPLDPMSHPTEANYTQELDIRRKLGEQLDIAVPPIPNDNDLVTLDVSKFRAEPKFQCGLFALYHVYQHWPDFMLHEPSYALARDAEGPNRYLGYLRQLKAAYPNYPLLIGEYGVSTSENPAHIHPQGWNNGGLTQAEQAKLLVRFSKNIRNTHCAGGVIFEWQDEWFKHVHDMNTADFELPWDRNPLWMNTLDPEKNFGLVGYSPIVPVPLLRGAPSDWQAADQLSSAQQPSQGGEQSPGELRAVYAMNDFAYLYLRLDLQGGAPLDWKNRSYWIALNTLPGESGSRTLPDIPVRLDSGANFLIELDGPTSGRILITDNYNPNHRVAVRGRPGVTRMARKRGLETSLVNSDPFQDIVTEVNQARYARDGTEFPPLDYDSSPLPYGTADPSSPDFMSRSLWHADAANNMIELRIPWGMLLMMDPSLRSAFAGTDPKRCTSFIGTWYPLSKTTPGISVAAFALTRDSSGRLVVTSSLPPLRGNQFASPTPLYTWKDWNQVQYLPYFKPSYYAIRKIFGEFSKSPVP